MDDGDSDSPQIPPVTDLTDSSGDEHEPQPKRHGKRKRVKAKKRAPVPIDDVVRVQTMLSKTGGCKADCKHLFRSKTGQTDLLRFRREWNWLHKTDQDEVVPSPRQISLMCLFFDCLVCCWNFPACCLIRIN